MLAGTNPDFGTAEMMVAKWWKLTRSVEKLTGRTRIVAQRLPKKGLKKEIVALHMKDEEAVAAIVRVWNSRMMAARIGYSDQEKADAQIAALSIGVW